MGQDVVGDLSLLAESLVANVAAVAEEMVDGVVDHQVGSGATHKVARLALVTSRSSHRSKGRHS